MFRGKTGNLIPFLNWALLPLIFTHIPFKISSQLSCGNIRVMRTHLSKEPRTRASPLGLVEAQVNSFSFSTLE